MYPPMAETRPIRMPGFVGGATNFFVFLAPALLLVEVPGREEAVPAAAVDEVVVSRVGAAAAVVMAEP